MIPKLCVCIPTFNRASDLAKLLDCLEREIGERDDVVVQISDNASGDGTKVLLGEVAASRPWLRVYRQDENVGPFRNLEWLIQHAPPAEYLWLFGDDDTIVPGALASVIEILEAEQPVWLFLPHHWIDEQGGVVGGSPAPTAVERFADAGDLFRAYDHWLTFLSASMVSTGALREAMHATTAENAYAPLLWYFRAGLDGPCCVAPGHWVQGGQATSWRDREHLYLTLHFTSLYDDGLHAALSPDEFGAALDGLYVRDHDMCHHWRRIELETLTGLVERFPRSEGLRAYLWTIALEQRRRDALRVVDIATRATGADVEARALVIAGEEAFAAGDGDAAARWFGEATQRAPTLAEAWNDLAVALHHLGRPGALQALDTALFVSPNYADAQSNRAEILRAC